jgi:hypothetical protein
MRGGCGRPSRAGSSAACGSGRQLLKAFQRGVDDVEHHPPRLRAVANSAVDRLMDEDRVQKASHHWPTDDGRRNPPDVRVERRQDHLCGRRTPDDLAPQSDRRWALPADRLVQIIHIRVPERDEVVVPITNLPRRSVDTPGHTNARLLRHVPFRRRLTNQDWHRRLPPRGREAGMPQADACECMRLRIRP